MPEITVTANGTEKLLSKLDPSKATGPDEISSRILKQYAHEFAREMAVLHFHIQV
jgi:hypothetical protein